MSTTRNPLLRSLFLYRLTPWRFSLTAGLFMLLNLSLSWQQWLVGRAIHDVETGKAVALLPEGGLDYSVGLHWLAILAAVALGRALIQYLAGVLALIIGQELLFNLREWILLQVQRLDLSYHWAHGVGEIVTRTTRDADKLRDALINFWRQVFETTLVVIAAVGLLCWYNLWLGLVPLLLTIVGISIFVYQTDQLVVLDRATGDAYDKVNQELSEGINGVRVIKAFGLESVRSDQFEGFVRTFVQQGRAALAYSTSRIPLPQFVVAIGQVWILGFGAQLVAAGKLNLGELVASLLIANTLVFRIEGVGRIMQIFADARASAARIWELLDAKPAIIGGSSPFPSGAAGFQLRDVGVDAPGGGIRILDNCSFTAAPGEVVALVGMTGAGKSTLAGLLPRLIDTDRGNVVVGSDKGGWLDLRNLDLAELRRHVHVLPQETFLFSDTLLANLKQAAPNASEDDLQIALHLAAADGIVENLREGLQTRLGDRGITLSGGQRQRLCLARALLSRPSILVLDDATSALDAVTEHTVLTNLRKLKSRAGNPTTVLLIGSKLSTILLADRVLLLADGKIADQGRHEDLVARNPAYCELLGVDHG